MSEPLFKINKNHWKKIYSDFKRSHPNLSKSVVYYCPYGWDGILIYLEDGMKLHYDRYYGRATILNDRWRDLKM